MQTFSTAFLNALDSDHFEYAYLVDLPVGQHYTNHGSDLIVGPDTYLTNGLLVKFANIDQTQELNLATYTLELSNVTNTLAKAYAAGSYRGLPAVIKLVLLIDGVVQGEPVVLYKGSLDSFSVRENGSTSNLTVKLTSHWASFNQMSGRYSSDKLQQDLFPGDDFFKYAHNEMSNIAWGKR